MSEKWVDCYICGVNAAQDEKDDYEDGFGPLCASCQDAITLYKEHLHAAELLRDGAAGGRLTIATSEYDDMQSRITELEGELAETRNELFAAKELTNHNDILALQSTIDGICERAMQLEAMAQKPDATEVGIGFLYGLFIGNLAARNLEQFGKGAE